MRVPKSSLARYCQGLEVVDATEPLGIHPNADDIKGAKKKDPRNCVFARACKRENPDAERVLFRRTTAHVEKKDKDGVLKSFRYVLPKQARKLIVDFDAGRKVPETGVTLLPPTPSQTLEGKLASTRAWITKRRKKRSSGVRKPEVKSSSKSVIVPGISGRPRKVEIPHRRVTDRMNIGITHLRWPLKAA